MPENVTIRDLLNPGRKTQNTELYEEILKWNAEMRFKEHGLICQEFRFTELGNWLIDHHRSFRDEYIGSHISKSYRLHAKRNSIKGRIQDLIDLGLIELSGTTKAEKNQTDIPIYKFSLGGDILGSILVAMKELKNTATGNAIRLVCDFLQLTNTSTFIFLSNFLTKCEKGQQYDNYGFVHMLRVLFSHLHPMGELNIRLSRIAVMCIPTLYPDLENIYFQTLNELDETTRKLLLFQFKLDIEGDYYHPYHPKETVTEWELTRLENICDYSRVTLSGKCEECQLSYSFTMDIFEFIKLPDVFGVEYRINPDTMQEEESMNLLQRIDCLKCGSGQSLLITPNWYSTEGVHPLVATWYTIKDPSNTGNG